MLCKRLLILLAVCLAIASKAWADDMGYVDCSSHPDGSQVYPKARQSQDNMGTVACGERFTILVYGFIFSRIQTSDNRIGYVFSNLISVDHSAHSVPQPPRPTVPASNVPAATSVSERTVIPRTQPEPAPKTTQAQVTSTVPAAPPAETPSVQTTPAQVTPPAPAATPSETTSVPQSSATAAQPSAPATPQPEPPAPQPTPAPVAPVSATPAPEPAPSAPATPAAAPEPAPATASEPQPAEPQPEPVRPGNARQTWEKPNPSARRQTYLLELYGGYAFSRFNPGGGASATNFNGALGAFGVNLKPWLQIAGDSSYNFVTVSGVKTVLYGNHFGPRIFYRVRSRWAMTPFAEALIGGSRLDTTVSGSGGYKTSENCISYKFGGGVDIHPSRRWEIRLFDVDFYRTAFGTNLHQNNYWASAGVVLRLFGGNSAE